MLRDVKVAGVAERSIVLKNDDAFRVVDAERRCDAGCRRASGNGNVARVVPDRDSIPRR